MYSPKIDLPNLTLNDIGAIFAISTLIIHLLYIVLLYYTKNMIRYVCFSNNFSTLTKKHSLPFQISLTSVVYLTFLFVLSGNVELNNLLLPMLVEIDILFHINIKLSIYHKVLTILFSYKSMHDLTLKVAFKIMYYFFCLFKRSLCLLHTFLLWVILLIIILSNDIEKNPGDFTNGFFSFCNWNLNSLAKDDFYRVQLLQAHNSIFNYDLISLCETSLNDSLIIPDPLINDYTFITSNNPLNVRHGGVGLLYKNSLPIKVRDDLSFHESIVVELRFGNKKIFFTVLYRNPAFKVGSVEFNTFLFNFQNLRNAIKNENPYAMFITGDFNGHSQLWWPLGGTTPEGSSIEEMSSLLGLSQLIRDPTNFEPNKNPSCIDLIFTDQPNLVLESGTRSSLDSFCHHQITYCRFNFKIPPPPPFKRKIWLYDNANVSSIKRSICNFPWRQLFQQNCDPNWQVNLFTETILNIMSNFIPNKIIQVVPRDPPWIDKSLKNMLNKQNRMYKNYKKHGFKPCDKILVDTFRDDCELRVKEAKINYLNKLGNKLIDCKTSQKSYWKIVNRVMNKCKGT